ncbi:MAG: fibronectin type III domain-containing protein, partial [Solirubrobacterales bacterium]
MIAALALMGLCAPIAHGDDDDDEPNVSARQATAISEGAATLNAKVHPGDDDEGPTHYVFQYGTTTGYGATTAVASFSDDDSRIVSVQISGLSPDTTYNFRAVAWNDEGDDHGSNRTFRTATLA